MPDITRFAMIAMTTTTIFRRITKMRISSFRLVFFSGLLAVVCAVVSVGVTTAAGAATGGAVGLRAGGAVMAGIRSAVLTPTRGPLLTRGPPLRRLRVWGA